jgi:hypothetical protein
MKKYIFINYFSEPDPARRAEYLYCVEKNVSCPFIDKVFIFVENDLAKKDIPLNDKIEFLQTSTRMEFKDIINYATANIENDSVIIILNLDVFIENSKEWENIDRDFFKVGYPNKGLVAKRHNLDENMNIWIEEHSWNKGEFCDAWILKTPFHPDFLKEDTEFCVGGAPQCDNLMMYLMSKYSHVYSWGSKYKIFHYDVARKQEHKSKLILNDKTDYRPSKRKTEHINIPANQDWDQLLKTGTQPRYLPTWKIQNKRVIKMSEFNCFTEPNALKINYARQVHLASLNLDIAGKRVLEVGAGIGLHTPFFLRRNCDVTITDGLVNNVAEIKRRHPTLNSFVLDLEQDTSLEQLGFFDIIYCYGLLYHLRNAESALKRMSEISNLLLLETVVSASKEDDISFLGDHGGNNGSIAGNACRPSRLWVLNQLKKNYGHGYITTTQPNYPDFCLDWENVTHSPVRSIFVGSKTAIDNPLLLTTVPMVQPVYTE